MNLTHIFFRYIYTLLKIFVFLTLLIPPIFIPLNIFRGKIVQNKIQKFDRFSWVNVDAKHINVYWAHFFTIVVTVIYICFVIYNEFFEFIRVRQKFLFSSQHGSSIYVNIVLVIDIFKNILFIEEFSDIFRVFPDGMRQVWINRNYRDLIKQVEKRENFVNILKSIEIIWFKKLVIKKTKSIKVVDWHDKIKNKKIWNSYFHKTDRDIKRLLTFEFDWLFSLFFIEKNIDVIEHNLQKLNHFNIEITKIQTFSDDLRLANSIFLQFQNQITSQLTCQLIVYHFFFRMIVHRLKIAPKNIIWPNLCFRWWNHYVRSILFIFSIFVLIFDWAFPIILTNLLSQITYLTIIMSWLKHLNRLSATLLRFFPKNFASSNFDYFLNFNFHDDTILCEKKRFFIKNLDWAYHSKILFFIFVGTNVLDCFSVIELCDNR